MANEIVILVTAKDSEEAEKIAKHLLQKKLIACSNIIKGVQSLFWWQGKVDEASESLLILKTNQKNLQSIIKEVKSVHSYDVPEVIALPIIAGNPDYLKWVNESIG